MNHSNILCLIRKQKRENRLLFILFILNYNAKILSLPYTFRKQITIDFVDFMKQMNTIRCLIRDYSKCCFKLNFIFSL